MKQIIVYGTVAAAAVLFAAGGFFAISAAAKPTPEAVVGEKITMENLAEQMQKMEEIEPEELADGGTLDLGEGLPPITSYFDEDSNIYTYSADGKLTGIMKHQTTACPATMSEEELFEAAQSYLKIITDMPERYALYSARMDNTGTDYHVAWRAYCCGYPTTDNVAVTINRDGTLHGYSTNRNGEFENVTVTPEQIEAAREQAREMALPDGETEDVRLKSVTAPEKVCLTYDVDGNLCAIVNVSLEWRDPYFEEDPFSDGWFDSGNDYFIPIV